MWGWFKSKADRPIQTPGEPPISYGDLRSLFEYLDRPNPPPCDHTLKESTEFLQAHNLPIDSTVAWLRANGGHCDCEVILNVADQWGEKVGFAPVSEDD